MSDGDSEAAALASVRDAMHGWISAALEAGRPIPEPRDDRGRPLPFDRRMCGPFGGGND